MHRKSVYCMQALLKLETEYRFSLQKIHRRGIKLTIKKRYNHINIVFVCPKQKYIYILMVNLIIFHRIKNPELNEEKIYIENNKVPVIYWM